MCGIVGYIGDKKAYPVLIKGLSRLEYRGYDSAGVALLEPGEDLKVYKRQGKVIDLTEFVNGSSTSGTIGIGHTRWATHGLPNDVNAHPHSSGDGKITLVHNGIIENYAILKKELVNRGHVFKSETDTEVLVHLIEDVKSKSGVSLVEAVRIALNRVHGAYAIVVISADDPNKIIAAKKSSPLVIGMGEDEYYLASDATPIVEYTKNVVYLEDEQIAIIDRHNGLRIISIGNQEVSPYVQELEMQLETIEKGAGVTVRDRDTLEQVRMTEDEVVRFLDDKVNG
jgi:glucosamine--fructose-6-phosphate aminotransferase (isomerizing)